MQRSNFFPKETKSKDGLVGESGCRSAPLSRRRTIRISKNTQCNAAISSQRKQKAKTVWLVSGCRSAPLSRRRTIRISKKKKPESPNASLSLFSCWITPFHLNHSITVEC
uniref:Uncharacterized protein n=1 Tax=Nelumbo nucifera TaxID=4432 RepID=A0A822Y9S5_NELNU|nr:TPA_asm: hypothetical protein HUJ06_030778 [Nelumbo nucifera]